MRFHLSALAVPALILAIAPASIAQTPAGWQSLPDADGKDTYLLSSSVARSGEQTRYTLIQTESEPNQLGVVATSIVIHANCRTRMAQLTYMASFNADGAIISQEDVTDQYAPIRVSESNQTMNASLNAACRN